MVAAALRQDAADVATYARVLTGHAGRRAAAGQRGDRVRAQPLSDRSRAVRGIPPGSWSGWEGARARCAGGSQPVAEIHHEVRGVVLSRDQVSPRRVGCRPWRPRARSPRPTRAPAPPRRLRPWSPEPEKRAIRSSEPYFARDPPHESVRIRRHGGVSGLTDPDEMHAGGRGYERGCELMTADANAAVAGAFTAGRRRRRHRRARQHQEHPRRPHRRALHADPRAVPPLRMGQGIGPSRDVAMFVGYHARAGWRTACSTAPGWAMRSRTSTSTGRSTARSG